jgi:hypothetical protein
VFAYIATATGRATWSVGGDGHRSPDSLESCPSFSRSVPAATTARASPVPAARRWSIGRPVSPCGVSRGPLDQQATGTEQGEEEGRGEPSTMPRRRHSYRFLRGREAVAPLAWRVRSNPPTRSPRWRALALPSAGRERERESQRTLACAQPRLNIEPALLRIDYRAGNSWRLRRPRRPRRGGGGLVF